MTTYKTQTKENHSLLIFIVIIIAILLNQSNIIIGINISFSDLFIVFLLLILIFQKQLVLPIKHFLFFLIISFIVIFTSSFYVPWKFLYSSELTLIIRDYIKLLAIFSYFLIGYNLQKINGTKTLIKWFSFGSLIMGFTSIIFTLLKIEIFSDILFFGDLRFRGLMNDPNYFAILQVVAVAYFICAKDLTKILKLTTLVILTLSVFISGSKTGIITLFIYLGFKLVEKLLIRKNKNINVVKGWIFLSVILIITSVTIKYKDNLMLFATDQIPAFSRVAILFTDFSSAISEGGSGRDAAWEIAVEIIKLSPIIGIGIGTYSGLGEKLWGYEVIAHNTYLQLAVEWGLLLTLIFFIYLFIVLIKATINRGKLPFINIMLRDILIIFLVGSIAISLNNARLFWLIFGSLIFNHYVGHRVEKMKYKTYDNLI